MQPSFFEDDDLPDYSFNDPYANLPDVSHLFGREAWRRRFQKVLDENENLTNQSKWDIGDCLVTAEVFGRLKEEQLEAEVAKTGRKWKTLRNWKVACRAFPETRRRDGLSFSFYVLLTKFEPKDQESALDRAEELQSQNKKRLRVKEFEKEITRLQRSGAIAADQNGASGGDKDTSKKHVKSEVPIKIESNLLRETYERLEAVAFKRYDKHVPNRLIWDMAFKYWNDHKEQLESMSKSDDPKLKKDHPLP